MVAKVGDEVITADEVKKRLDETSPFLRARYNTLDKKKEFVENLIRNELLAQEAKRQGLDQSPAVKEQMKRAIEHAACIEREASYLAGYLARLLDRGGIADDMSGER